MTLIGRSPIFTLFLFLLGCNWNSEILVKSQALTVLPTPPSLVLINDDIAYTLTTTSPEITWTYNGSIQSGAENYSFEVALGTTSGATDVQTWTNVGTVTTKSFSSLSLIQLQKYYATVRVVDSSGNVQSTLAGDGWTVVPASTVEPRYSLALNWNAYQKIGPEAACTGTTSYFDCVHGGEQKKFTIAAMTSCAGLSAQDELDVFDWFCNDNAGAGPVNFFSRGLKEGKGLADLITATTWKNNRLLVFSGTTPIYASERTAWWTNNIVPLLSASFTPVANTIYTISTTLTFDDNNPVLFYDLVPTAINGTALVTLGDGMILLSDTGNGPVFQGFGTFYSWFEGRLSCQSGYGEFFTSFRRSVFKNLKVSHCGDWLGFFMTYNYFNNIVVSDSTSVGVRINSSSYNVFEKAIFTSVPVGITVTDLEASNVFLNILISNSSNRGIYTYDNSNNHYIGLTIANGSWHSVMTLGTTNMVLKNVLTLNNNSGFDLNNDVRATIENAAVKSVNVNTGDNLKFTGNLIIQSATNDCTVTAGTNPGLVHGTCANNGSSNKTLRLDSAFATNSFPGFINVDDAINTSDILGSQSFTNISNWTDFENVYRFWAPDSVFNTAGARGKCSTGQCRIMDLMPLSNDTVIKNTSVGVTVQNNAFIKGAACPAQLHGNVVTVTAKAAPITYLTHAREIMGTGGNNNGLCESNESCLYLPNFGAYQGSGDFWNNQCTFTNGTVTGARIFAYPIN